MTCSETRARLPLLVYGDLPAPETAQVREHLFKRQVTLDYWGFPDKVPPQASGGAPAEKKP